MTSESFDMLAWVRDRLKATPREDWEAIGSAADVSVRTMQRIAYEDGSPDWSPRYVAVGRLMAVLQERKAAEAA